MRGEECGPGAAGVSLDARARANHGDAAIGERIGRAALGHEKRGTGIPLQVLGMLGERADQEYRVSVVKSDGHERSVRVTLRLEGKSAERSGRDPCDQRSRALGMVWCRNIHVVQGLGGVP